MKMKKIVVAGVLAGSVLSLNSCWFLVAGAAGAGTVAYVQGKYTMNVNGSLKDVYNAAIEAAQSNDNYVISKKTITPTTASVNGSTKVDPTDFSITIEKLTDKASKVTIKFGTFGDRAASEALMNQIQKDLS
jgi:hypothetical protein